MNQDDSRHSSKELPDSDKTPITVYDPKYFAPEHTETQRGGSVEAVTEHPDETKSRPATTQERFAAFFVDLLIFAAFGFAAFALLGLAVKQPLSGWTVGAIWTGLHLLYYFLTEAFLGTSPGKRLAGLRLRQTGGGRAPIAAVLIRNVLRIVDYPLFFLAAGLMETTQRRQRLGDLAADTEVVRTVSFEAKRLPPEITPLAGATRRALAWMLDLSLVLPFLYGLLLLAPVSRPTLAGLVAAAALPVTLLLLAACETFFQTTAGKALLGMKVAQEDGRPASFATVLLRNVFKLLDANPVGYLCALLSSRKQRPGDIAAGTLVFRDRKGLNAWWPLLIMAFLALVVGRLGYVHADSFLRRNTDLKIGPVAFHPLPKAVQRLRFLHLGIVIEELDLGLTDASPNPGRNFIPGQAVYLQFRIAGYTVQEGKAWIQADVRVLDGDKNVVLDRADAINSSLNVGTRTSARLITRFSLSPQSPPGFYTVILTIRDMFVGKSVEERLDFTVR